MFRSKFKGKRVKLSFLMDAFVFCYGLGPESLRVWNFNDVERRISFYRSL